MARRSSMIGAGRPVIYKEEDARLYGRQCAREIFEASHQWQPLPLALDDLKECLFYHSTTPNRLFVRAVRPLKGFSLQQIEEMFLSSYQKKIYESLFQEHHKNGGKLIDFHQQQHETGEREAVNLQWMSLADSDSASITRFVFLEYLLSTVLKRVNSKGKTKSLPSLLHLIRGADFPHHSQAFLQGKNHNLSFTLIIQETAGKKQGSLLSIEVMGAIDIIGVDTKQQEQYLKQLVQAISQIERLFQTKTQISQMLSYPDAATRIFDEQTQVVGAAAANFNAVLPMSLPTNTENKKETETPASHCGICKKKFNAFRWKHQCQLCCQYTCNQCYSVLTNPASMRRKTRVCNSCLYEPNAGTTAVSTARYLQSAAATAVNAATKARSTRRNSVPFTNDGKRNGGKKIMKGSAAAATAEASTSGLPDSGPTCAAPNATLNSTTTATTRTNRAQTDATRGRGAAAGGGSSMYYSDYESDYDSQTEEHGGSLSRASRTSSSSIRMSRNYRTSLGDFSHLTTSASRSRASSTSSVKTNENSDSLEPIGISVRQNPAPLFEEEAAIANCLLTHEVDYEVDFNWFHPFPKAPQPIAEPQRVDCIVSMGLDDEETLTILKKHYEIQSFLKKAIALTSTFNGASLNIITKNFVVCLGSLTFDGKLYQKQTIEESMLPRPESASSYALYHDEPFYIARLEEDVRFRAHPLVIEMDAKRFLSLPIYSSSKANGGHMCIGTLDLWYKTPRFTEAAVNVDAVQGGRRGHGGIPFETVQVLESLALQISMSIENITRQVSMKTQQQQRRRSSGGYNGYDGFWKRRNSAKSSTCDSRGSTKRDDSFELDLDSDFSHVVQEEEEHGSVNGSPQFQQPTAPTGERLSLVDIESTIEALLNQVNQTYDILRQSQTIHMAH